MHTQRCQPSCAIPTPITRLKIHAATNLPSDAKVRLAFIANNRYRIWSDEARTEPVTNLVTEFNANADVTLYFEGLKKSESVSGESVSLVYYSGTNTFYADSVKFTVVEAEFRVWLNMFIPVQWGDLPILFNLDPPIGRKIFGGDDRGFYNLPFGEPNLDVDAPGRSTRVHQQITVIPYEVLDADGVKNGSIKQAIGLSHNYLKSSSVPHPDLDYSPTNRLLSSPTITSSGRASIHAGIGIDTSWVPLYQKTLQVNLYGSADNPIVTPSFAIDWNLHLFVSSIDVLNPVFEFLGYQDGFPACEVYIMDSDGHHATQEGTVVYQYDPIPLGLGPDSLMNGVDDVSVNESGEIK